MKRNFRLCLSAAILLMAALATASCADAVAPLADEPTDVPGTPAEDFTGKPIQIGNVVSLAANDGAKTRTIEKDPNFPKDGSTMTVFCFAPNPNTTKRGSTVSPDAHANYTYKGGSWHPTAPNAPLCWQHSTWRHFFAAVSPAVDDTEVDFGAKAKGLVNGTNTDMAGNNYVSGIYFDPAFSLPTTWTNELYASWGQVRSTTIGNNCAYRKVPKANAQIELALCRPLVSVNIISESTKVTLRDAPAATSNTSDIINITTKAMHMLSSGDDGLVHCAYTLPYCIQYNGTSSMDISFVTDDGASKSTVSSTGLTAGSKVEIIKEGANMSAVTNSTAGGLSTALSKVDPSKKKIVIGGTINDADMSALKTFITSNSITDVVILAEGVTSIRDDAFQYCTSLKSISLPEGVTSIGNNAFSKCTSLKSISLPKGVTSIANGTFTTCSSLTSISLPDRVTSIGNDAFFGCSSLKSINLPERVTSIGNSAFCGCSSLKSITLPEGVTSIGETTFYDCNNLTSISLPDGVTSIGSSAFQYCSNLEEISLSGINDQYEFVLPTLGSGAFANTKLNTLYLRDVPEATFKENLSTYSIWGGITWETIHYGYNGPDDDLYHTDAAYYSGHWFAPTP